MKKLSTVSNSGIIYGDMRTKDSILELENLCKDIDENMRNTIIEIGCYRGESTSVFCKYFKRVICIDPWLKGYDKTDRGSTENGDYIKNDFINNMKSYKNITIIKKFSYNAINDIEVMLNNTLVDAIYIDAGHQYEDVSADLKNYEKFVKKNGYICGDDYKIKYPGLMKSVNEFRNKKEFIDKEFKIYKNNSFMLKK